MGGLAGVLITGCAATGRLSTIPEARPLGAQYPSTGQPGQQRGEVTPKSSAPTGELKLEQALATALLRNPDLEAFSYEVRAAEARILQARVLPNPELELELEEYDRGGEGFDSSETAVVLGQLFELGGKRRWRTRVAEAESELAGWDYESMRLDVFTETAQRFTAVIAAQKRVDLSRSAVELAEKTSNAVSERVKAGKEPPLQASKSEAELEMARMDALEAENALGIARKKLAAMWGAEQADFEMAAGSLDRVLGAIPSLAALRSRLSRNPDLARWEVELRLRQATLSSERAARIPDLQASVGYQKFEEDGTDALAFGVGVPLPLFDRNQGNIAAAGHELSKAEAERSATELTLAAELAETHASLTGSRQRVITLRDKVVPAMEQAFGAAHEGYKQGKFGFLDMLDAQRGLFEAKGALVDALSDYHTALTEIQRITGTSIEELINVKQED
jgi:cobalt-zinc-cadmium efflux system outer membrane protein